MTSKTLVVSTLAALAMLFSPSRARADVVEPPTAFFLLPAGPGLLVSTGAIVTTVGCAVTVGDEEPDRGWAVAGIVLGSLSLVSGSIYTGIVADGSAAPGLFGTVATTNFMLGASSLTLGIVGATTDASPTTLGLIPRVAVDEKGRPFAMVSGAF